MSMELSKNLMCIIMRNGIEIWVEREKSEKIQQVLSQTRESKFVQFEGQMINTADIVGIFNATTVEELTRRKNGQWQCNFHEWHEKNKKCDCALYDYPGMKKKEEAIKNCGKCDNGFIKKDGNTVTYCDCLKSL